MGENNEIWLCLDPLCVLCVSVFENSAGRQPSAEAVSSRLLRLIANS